MFLEFKQSFLIRVKKVKKFAHMSRKIFGKVEIYE